MRYTVIVEEGATSWGAYVPDLPGCVAAGATREEAMELICGTIEFHLEGLKEGGESCRSGLYPLLSKMIFTRVFKRRRRDAE